MANYFASRKRINHMHYRNVMVEKPYEKYTELFIDAGLVDMFGVMKAIVKNKYNGTIYPEHPRALDYDRDRGRIGGYPGGGGYAGITYSVAYARGDDAGGARDCVTVVSLSLALGAEFFEALFQVIVVFLLERGIFRGAVNLARLVLA